MEKVMQYENSIARAFANGNTKTAFAPVEYCPTTNSYSDLFFVKETPLSKVYFDPANIEMIRTALTEIIFKEDGLKIGLQPLRPLKLSMMNYFNDVSCDMNQYDNVDKNLQFVNTYTLVYLTRRIRKNIQQQLGMYQWVEERLTTVKMPNPTYDNYREKTLPLSLYYNGCPRQL